MSFETPFKQPAALRAGEDENINHVNLDFQAIENVLDNGITYRDHFNQDAKGLVSHVYNAADFGTFGTGAAIQAAIDQVEDDAGGVIYIPQGDWTVNGGLVVQPEVPTHLVGAGRPLAGVSFGGGTRLIRTSGTNTLLQIGGDSDNAFTAAYSVRLQGMELRGSGTAGYLLDAAACNPLQLFDLGFVGTDGTGVRLRQIFNSFGHDLDFRSMGKEATSAAACVLGGLAVSQGGCDTVLWSRLMFEGNAYSDLKLTGDPGNTANRNCNNLQFENVKMEAGTGAGPYIELDYAQKCKFATVNIAQAGRTGPTIHENNPFTGSQPNHFNGLTIEYNNPTPTPAYTMYLQSGGWVLGTVNIVSGTGQPSTALIRVDSGGSVLRYNPRTIYSNNASSNKIVSDARSFPSIASASTVTLPYGESVVKVTGTAAIDTITAAPAGERVTLIFTSTATLKHGTGNVRLNLGADFGPATSDDAITLVSDGSTWYGASPGSVN